MEKDIIDFYDFLSDDYDSMTGFEGRIIKEEPFFNKLIDGYKLNNALDIGCGTGLHSILLAKSGLNVTGIDHSMKMIEKALENSKKNNINVNFINSDIIGFKKYHKSDFDSIFCMGNILPHFRTISKLNSMLKIMKLLLKKGGILVLQILNYDKILFEKERIVNIRESNGRLFVRFYDFLDKNLRFNILIIEEKSSLKTGKIFSTELYPYKKIELINAVKKCGLGIVNIFGGLNFEKFDRKKSGNFILVLKK